MKGLLQMRKYIVIIVIIVLATGVASFAYYNRRIAPLLIVQQSLSNLSYETTERINTSPLMIVGLLSDALENGSVFVNSRLNVPPGVIANLSLSTNAETSERALEIGISFMRLLNVNLEAYMNTQRVAVRVLPIVDNFYGFTYDTFREDIQIFGRTAGFDNATMDMLSSMVETLDETLNASPREESLLQPYIDVLIQFLRRSSFTTSRDSGYTLVRFSFDNSEIVALLESLHITLQYDEDLRTPYEIIAFPSSSIPSFDSLLEQLYYIIRNLDDTIEHVTLQFTIENRRLQRVTATVKPLENAENTALDAPSTDTLLWNTSGMTENLLVIAIDFGQSALCPWTININDNEATAVWSFTSGDTYVHSLLLQNTSFQPIPETSQYKVTSEWTPVTSDFTLSVNDSSFSGILNLRDDGSFRLRMDTFVPFEISARQETPHIQEIEFINLDMWDMGLLGALMDIYNFAVGLIP